MLRYCRRADHQMATIGELMPSNCHKSVIRFSPGFDMILNVGQQSRRSINYLYGVMFMKQERDYLAIFSVYGGGSAYARMSTEVAAVKHAARQAFYSYDIPEGAEMGITVHDVTGYKTVTWENGAVGLTGWKTSEAYESDPMNLEGTGDDLDDRHVRLIVIRAPNRKKRMFDEKLSAQIVDAYCNIPTVPKNKGIGSR